MSDPEQNPNPANEAAVATATATAAAAAAAGSDDSPAIPIDGRSAFLLEDPLVSWRIESGRLAVFKATAQNGVPVGARRFLFNCQRGESLFGQTEHQGNGQTNGHASDVLIAVGLEDSLIQAVPLTSLAA